eukprot:2351941-Rhodomonas_salina.1
MERSKEEDGSEGGELAEARDTAVGVLVERGATLLGLRGHDNAVPASAQRRLAHLRQDLLHR